MDNIIKNDIIGIFTKEGFTMDEVIAMFTEENDVIDEFIEENDEIDEFIEGSEIPIGLVIDDENEI